MPESSIDYGTVLWTPSRERVMSSRIYDFIGWIDQEHSAGIGEANYDALWDWSTRDVETFWESIVEYFDLELQGEYATALRGPIESARWFEGTATNFAKHLLERAASLDEAVIAVDETGARRIISGKELETAVTNLAANMRDRGLGRGDVVASYMPNIPETLVAFLATASLGAVWTSCSPDFGRSNVIDRFAQVEPKWLFVIDGYYYGGEWHDRRSVVQDIRHGLPSLDLIVEVTLDDGGFEPGSGSTVGWDDVTTDQGEGRIEWDIVPFEHPLWVLYSSGTTGLPKAIVHSHGGTLLEQAKSNGLHLDLSRGDRFFWFSTTGWVMWNLLVSALIAEATIVLYDGDLNWPDPEQVWRIADRNDLTFLGLGAGHILAAMKRSSEPGNTHDLTNLQTIGSTGSPLSPEGYAWVYDAVKSDVLIASISGGTDVATAFLGGAPILPVFAGEIQRPTLAADVAAFDEDGNAVVGEVGELVVRQPMPSMPIYLWGDDDRSRLRESYFDMFPGVWRHGDWIEITERGTCVVYGRSDATLNRGGVRMGTSEFYRVLDTIDEIEDSLIVDTGEVGQSGELLLFVKMAPGKELTSETKDLIGSRLRAELSPRHRPDETYEVGDIPRTLSGKRMEVPVKHIIRGEPIDEILSEGAMTNPESLNDLLKVREQRAESNGSG